MEGPNSTLANMTNSTVADEDPLLALCREWRPAAYVHLGALPIWICMLLWWSRELRRREGKQAGGTGNG